MDHDATGVTKTKRLEEKQEEYDYLRWSIMPKRIQKMFEEDGRNF